MPISWANWGEPCAGIFAKYLPCSNDTWPCLTTATCRSRNNFSQWERGFLWKLRFHCLNCLRQRQIAVLRKGAALYSLNPSLAEPMVRRGHGPQLLQRLRDEWYRMPHTTGIIHLTEAFHFYIRHAMPHWSVVACLLLNSGSIFDVCTAMISSSHFTLSTYYIWTPVMLFSVDNPQRHRRCQIPIVTTHVTTGLAKGRNFCASR